MNFKGSQNHLTDFVFVLGLFVVFAGSIFASVIIGISVYRETIDNLNNQYTSRTATTYVVQKIRQNNRDGSVTLGQIGGQPAIVIKGESEGIGTTTYLYGYENKLIELYVKDGAYAMPGQGQTITDVKSFQPADAGGGLIELNITDSKGHKEVTYLHLCPKAEGGSA